jgi:hypothetical protein
MGHVPRELVAELQRDLQLIRAIETGTYRGHSAKLLAGLFDSVVTIELSEELHRRYSPGLIADHGITALQGDSRTLLRGLVEPDVPTLYFLDGHWSGGVTAGEDAECPVLEELDAIAAGNEADCILIDDARLFAAPPPPPHDREQWPTLVEVFDALRRARPEHHVTMLVDLVIAVPPQARRTVDTFGQTHPMVEPGPLAGLAGQLGGLYRRQFAASEASLPAPAPSTWADRLEAWMTRRSYAARRPAC